MCACLYENVVYLMNCFLRFAPHTLLHYLAGNLIYSEGCVLGILQKLCLKQYKDKMREVLKLGLVRKYVNLIRYADVTARRPFYF